jgi:hypothetical protein
LTYAGAVREEEEERDGGERRGGTGRRGREGGREGKRGEGRGGEGGDVPKVKTNKLRSRNVVGRDEAATKPELDVARRE